MGSDDGGSHASSHKSMSDDGGSHASSHQSMSDDGGSHASSHSSSSKKSSSNSESNDDQMPVVAPTPPPPCSDVSVVVTTDDNPTQNSYTVISSLGKEVMSGNGFTVPRKTYTLTKCLPYGDYLFTMYDIAGNGMCCVSGPGGYNLYANDVLLKAGGVF